MDLRAAILGLLSWKPASGYDLKRLISSSEVFYWSGNNNQIYKTLLELQSAGLVTNTVEVQDRLPAKKVYSITAQGQAELRRSLLAGPQPPELRKDFLIQLAWAEPLTDAELLPLLETYAAEIDARLQMARNAARLQTGGEAGSPARSPRERYLWQRIAQNLIAAYQAELDWANQTLTDLRTGNYPGETP